jgi:CheY-like chemotaxis protein
MNDSKLLLVVEDVPGIRELLELSLRFKNFEVIGAQDGQEALDMIRNRRPALIISDILMPQMDGFSLLYRLKSNPATRDIPVVFISATYISPEDKEFAKTLGVTRFIEKPIDMEDFLSMIGDLVKEPPAPQPPLLKESEFLEQYRGRLEAKLAQKNQQVARAERLLETAIPTETSGFEASLRQALNERKAIEVELENLKDILNGHNSTL